MNIVPSCLVLSADLCLFPSPWLKSSRHVLWRNRGLGEGILVCRHPGVGGCLPGGAPVIQAEGLQYRPAVLASSIRGLQTLSLQHFAVRDPVLATDDATRIGSDGYLMSLRRDAGWWLSHVTSGTDCAK